MYEVSNKAISQHRGFKTTIQVFNNFWNILWDMMLFQNTINQIMVYFPIALRKFNNVTIKDR